MGIFDKLFGKKNDRPVDDEQPAAEKTATTMQAQLQPGNVVIGTGDNVLYKVIRDLNQVQKEKLAASTLRVMTAQLYMHYWTDGLVCTDPNDPKWLNQAVFFWKAEEPFPKKSLPPAFETFETRYFVFTGELPDLKLSVGQAMPWFGMPGLGEKHVCELHGQMIAIPELSRLKVVQYVTPATLQDDNLDILQDTENYFLLTDSRLATFQNEDFYLGDKPVRLETAYSVGGVHIVKKVNE